MVSYIDVFGAARSSRDFLLQVQVTLGEMKTGAWRQWDVKRKIERSWSKLSGIV